MISTQTVKKLWTFQHIFGAEGNENDYLAAMSIKSESCETALLEIAFLAAEI